MANERVRLQWLLKRLRATLTDADGHRAKSEGMAAWLRKLRVLACDIEDVLDEFEYQDLLRVTQVEGGGGGGGGGDAGGDSVSSLPPPPSEDHVPAVVDRIAGIRGRVNEIMEDKEALDMLGEFDDEETDVQESAESRDQIVENAPAVSESEMVGRDREKDETVGFLLGSPTDDLSVLAVVGIGGVGKTTLAMSAYNDGKVEDHFDLRIWVHVSYSFDVWRITKQLVQLVTDPDLMLHEIDNFDVLQITLANKLRDRSFLLVLDDMWFEDSVLKNNTAWETLCAPLICGGKGSKILVTTRSTQVVGVMQPVKTIRLEGLGPEDSWSLFKKHAFLDGDADKSPNLEDIGKEIVKKLEGVPLAIRAIGGLLRSTASERDWRNVLESKLWELEHGGEDGGILPALRISYEHLQPHLKPCFAYCSVYSKGREFDKLELVQQWMALGYIEPRRGRQMEDVGNDYVNSLVNRSLIQILEGKYTVHDLLHDLGRGILQRDFCKVTSDQVHQITEEDQQKYHLSIHHKKVDGRDLAKLQKFWRLRTCLFVFSHRFALQIPSILFPNMTCLRVLHLSGGGIHALSDSIDNLKHLRYLDLSRTSLRSLPESLCNLYMLQTLRLKGCEELEKLPKDMRNLVGLRHLEAKQELISGIFGIGRLVQLQEVEEFSISEGNGIRIEDLKDMNELRGKLCIRNLQRVGSKEEAGLANLSSKKYVKRLELEWAGDLDENQRNSELEEAVLDALVPPLRLKELTIRYYAGEDFPCWMEHQFISGLESISLYRCQRWEQLPPLVGLLPFLKKLEISYFPRLIELPSFPATLTHLRLEGMGLASVPALQGLPSLQELIVCDMPGLKELPPLPIGLSVFRLEELSALRDLPAFDRVHGGQQLRADGFDNCSRPQLHEVKIAGCQKLRSLGGLLRDQLPCLSKLSIENCGELVSWPTEDGLQTTLLSLQELSIRGCPKLTALPQGSVLSPDMRKLTVEGCPSFPDGAFFAQTQNMKNLNRQGDVFVEKQYPDLRRCSEEALKHLRSINWLIIQFVQQDGAGGSPCLIEYDIQQVLRRARVDLACYRRVILKIAGNGGGEEEEEEERRSAVPTCLGHRHLCSSLFSLSIHGIPQGASFLPQGGAEEDPVGDGCLTPNLPSLEELVLVRCNDMKQLPVETMLRHLRKLKQLSLVGCPELTLPSMEEALRSLPSLQKLVIIECFKLSLPSPDAVVDDGGNSVSAPPPLRSLAMDDVELLAIRRFTGTYLSTLHELALWYSDLCSFPASMDCLKSLHSLTLIKCPNLLEFPGDFKSLFPSLEALCIKDCPLLRCIPEAGMPASLEVLAIYTSPSPEEDDWAKVAHVRLIILERKIVQGKYSDYRDLLSKGKVLLLPS